MTTPMTNYFRPASLLLCDFVSSLQMGDQKNAQAHLEDFLSSITNVLTKDQLHILTLSQKLYGSRTGPAVGWHRLKDKILANDRLHILFINDVGFNAGAGIGMARQAQSFLKQGHDISLICGRDDPNLGCIYADRYLGEVRHSISVKTTLARTDCDRLTKARYIYNVVKEFDPDVVITGNFHAFAMPSEIILQLQKVGVPVFVYAHDCDWITGGCAHYLYYECNNYLTGCTDDNCPKGKNTYPPLLGATITGNWSERSYLFSKIGIPLVTNSRWNRDQHHARFGSDANIELLHLGIDTDIFRPLDKCECKKKLGIPKSHQFIVAGSGFLRVRGKGGATLQNIFEHYRNRPNITVGYFGGTSAGDLPDNVLSLGYIRNEEQMATIFSAADVFVNPVTIEAFGQTMLEAAACGCPIVSYDACGCIDISISNLTGIHADQRDVADFIKCIDTLLADETLRNRLSSNGPVIVRHFFSLSRQAAKWRTLLLDTALKQQYLRFAPVLNQFNDKAKNWFLPRRKLSQGQSNGMEPRISVITVVYNCGTEFHRTAHTILSQTYNELEWVVIDGGSTSMGTRAILEFYRPSIDVFISEPDEGIYDAMGKGAERATGLWTIYLGSGDYFAGDHAVEHAVAEADETVDLIIGNVIEERLDGSFVQTAVLPVKDKISALAEDRYEGPWMRGLPPHQGTFMKTELIRRFGFDQSFKISADWDLIFRVASQPDMNVMTIDGVVAYYPNGGFSANNNVLWVEEVKRIAAKYCGSSDKLNNYFDRVIAHHHKINAVRQAEGFIHKAYLKATKSEVHVE